MAMAERNLKLDSKKRITIGKYAKNNVTSYDIQVDDNGVITLYPKVEIPASELWLFDNKEALNSVKKGLQDSSSNNIVERGSFAKYAEE